MLGLWTQIPKQQQQTQVPLSELVTRSIAAANPKLSEARKTLLAKMLTGIATEIFVDREHAVYWIVLLGVESGYDGKLVSPVKATGIGQLMPQYADGFAKNCGLGSIVPTDINDDYTNAYLSACEFKRLIELNSGSVPLALVAYNAGSHSHSSKQAKKGDAPVAETSAYVAKTVLRKDQMEREP